MLSGTPEITYSMLLSKLVLRNDELLTVVFGRLLPSVQRRGRIVVAGGVERCHLGYSMKCVWR